MNANTNGPEPRKQDAPDSGRDAAAHQQPKPEQGQRYRHPQPQRVPPASREASTSKSQEIQHAQVSLHPRKNVEEVRAQQVRFRLRIPKQLRTYFPDQGHPKKP